MDEYLEVIEELEDRADELESVVFRRHAVPSRQLIDRLSDDSELTVWAAIILVPTLIVGIYGMNFRHMPGPAGWSDTPSPSG